MTLTSTNDQDSNANTNVWGMGMIIIFITIIICRHFVKEYYRNLGKTRGRKCTVGNHENNADFLELLRQKMNINESKLTSVPPQIHNHHHYKSMARFTPDTSKTSCIQASFPPTQILPHQNMFHNPHLLKKRT